MNTSDYLHITYKITFHDTGFYYFGKHSTRQLNDRYKGSGVEVVNLIRQKKLHSFEMIALHESSGDAYDHEKSLIGNRYITDPTCLNKIRGGIGIRNFKGKPGVRTPRKDKQKVLASAKLGAAARRGQKDSPEVNARRSASVHAATIGKPKPWLNKTIEIDGITYSGFADACENLKLSRYIIRTRLKSKEFPTWKEIPK